MIVVAVRTPCHEYDENRRLSTKFQSGSAILALIEVIEMSELYNFHHILNRCHDLSDYNE